MSRNPKVLSLALGALMALGVMASAASAHKFKSEAEHTIITGLSIQNPGPPMETEANGEEENIFTTNTGAAVKCKHSEFKGDQVGLESESVTVVPKYEMCDFAGNPANVTVTDCAYVLSRNTNANGDAPVEIECEAGGFIKVEVPGVCTLDINNETSTGEPQKLEGGVHYWNETNSESTTADDAVTIEATVSNIKVKNKTGGAIACAFAGSTGTYTGSVTAKGYEFVSNSGTKTTPTYTEGNQVGIRVEGAEERASPVIFTGLSTQNAGPLMETTANGEEENVFTTNTGAAVHCTRSEFKGDKRETKSVTVVTVVPKYEMCTFNGNAANVTVTDCAYLIDTETDENGDAAVAIECEPGGLVQVEVPGVCTLDINNETSTGEAQKLEGGVHFWNETNGAGTADDAVTAKATVSNIKVKAKTGGKIACAFAGTTGTYTGSVTVKGYEFGTNTGTRMTPSYTEGAQVGISVEEAEDK